VALPEVNAQTVLMVGDNGGMPLGLRSKIALVALLAAFLIPVGTSSLRGLTHILTCSGPEEVPFTLVNPEVGEPSILSSATLARGAERGVCGGLVLDVAAQPDGPGRVLLDLSIVNQASEDWHGTVQLRVGDTTVPVAIGAIAARATEEDTVQVRVSPGAVEVNAALLVGP
jgi:hypothetical protein